MPIFAEIDREGRVLQVAGLSGPPDAELVAHVRARERRWLPLDPALAEEVTAHPERFMGAQDATGAWRLERR